MLSTWSTEDNTNSEHAHVPPPHTWKFLQLHATFKTLAYCRHDGIEVKMSKCVSRVIYARQANCKVRARLLRRFILADIEKICVLLSTVDRDIIQLKLACYESNINLIRIHCVLIGD